MRRPLFTYGIPQLLDVDSSLDVLDITGLTEDLQSHVYTLTLFAYFPSFATLTGTTADVGVNVTSDGDEVLITRYPPSVLNARAAANFGSVLIVEQLPLRGKQKVSVKNFEAAGGVESQAFIYGYYELDGERSTPEARRPLQPDINKVRETAAPFRATNGQTVVVHQLSPDYIDLLSLSLGAQADAVDATNLVLNMPTGVSIPVPAVETTANVLPSLPLFQGIPMRAPSSEDSKLEMVAGNAATNIVGVTLGRFTRG